MLADIKGPYLDFFLGGSSLSHSSAHQDCSLTCSYCKSTDLYLFDFGDVNWRQAEAWNLLLPGRLGCSC